MAMMTMATVPSARTRTLPPRDARGRFMARPGAALNATHARPGIPRDARGRSRSLPPRDARGRFIAFPTTDAPSWYVLSADGYRIPGEADVTPQRLDVPPAPEPHPLPVAKAMRRPRRSMDWAELATWILMALFIVVVGWHGFHLQRPHR
jgi:hypothetical protein